MASFVEYSEKIINFRLPRYEELPSIDLYMDQLICYIETVLAPLQVVQTEKPITTAMVNNYIKQGVIPSTEKKKYSKKHIAYLLVVGILKQIYTIQEIGELVKIQAGCFDLYTAYDYFCTELELALKAVFTQSNLSEDTAKTSAEQKVFVRNSVIAYANKLNVQKLICYLENGK